MICDWEGKSLQFAHGDTTIYLQGVQPVSTMQLKAMSVEQLDKALHGNDIWAMAVVDPSSGDVVSTPGSYPEDLTAVLTDFQDVFETPTGLPPHRVYDHAITLEVGHNPPNSRPYRYSPQQKDEIERQVVEMIKAGIVKPSMSPYASPVLLVKKKTVAGDSAWITANSTPSL